MKTSIQNPTKEPFSFLKVRFSDCDPFRHLNNGRYIDYFLNAREDHLAQHYGIILHELGKEGITWVVAQNQLNYLKPALLGENLLIKTSVIEFSESHILVEMVMFDEKASHIKSVLWTKFVHFDVWQGKKRIHSPEFLSLFEKVKLEVPVEQLKNFDLRTSVLIQEMKISKPSFLQENIPNGILLND
jgi:acyl-CoA thioester hydrolase